MTNTESAAKLRTKLGEKTAQVGVVGLGYVGLPLSLLFARAGFFATGFDVAYRGTRVTPPTLRHDQLQAGVGFADDLVHVAEKVLGILEDLVDFFLEVGAEAAVGGDFPVLGFLDDLARDSAAVLQDGDVGAQGRCEQNENAEHAHGSPSRGSPGSTFLNNVRRDIVA